jgi:predicted transcriptional regulator
MESQLTVRLPATLQRKLARYAKNLRLKRSDVIRLALEEFLIDVEEDRQKPYVQVKRLLGGMESGILDLGTEHRKHLIKRFKRA